MSLTEVLINILDLPKLTAIEELIAFKSATGAADFRSAVKSLPRQFKPALVELNSTEINRRKIPTFEGLRVGDRVQVRSMPLGERQVSRGRLKQSQIRRRVMEKRVGQCRESIGWMTGRGSRKLFYVRQRNLDRVVGTFEICCHPSLVGVKLTIVEFMPPFVHCLRPSGCYAPGLLVEDLEIAIDSSGIN